MLSRRAPEVSEPGRTVAGRGRPRHLDEELVVVTKLCSEEHDVFLHYDFFCCYYDIPNEIFTWDFN